MTEEDDDENVFSNPQASDEKEIINIKSLQYISSEHPTSQPAKLYDAPEEDHPGSETQKLVDPAEEDHPKSETQKLVDPAEEDHPKSDIQKQEVNPEENKIEDKKVININDIIESPER